MARLWNDRLSWSGEIPTDYPHLNPVALCRFDQGSGNGLYADDVNGSREWQHIQEGTGVAWGRANGPRGARMQLNGQDPNTQRGRVQLNHFSGLWPSTGRVLVGAWVWQRYIMAHNPIIDTRSASTPFVYLATYASGNPRMQVYGANGSVLLDQQETALPWRQTTDAYFLGMIVDSDGTAQMISAHSDGRSWAGPVRAFSGTPAFGGSADLEVFSLRSGSFYESGFVDEVLVAHPASDFDVADFAAALGRGAWANGQERPGNETAYSVSNTGITRTASGTGSFRTGAELVEWDREPVITGAPAGATWEISSNGGTSWSSPSSLPATFSGLMRWNVTLTSGQRFDGIDLTVPTTPDPTLDPISAVSMLQGELEAIPLTWTAEGAASWRVASSGTVSASVVDGVLMISAGFQTGAATVTVTLTDGDGRTVSQTAAVTVTARQWDEGAPPRYPHAPVVLWDDQQPQEVLIDPMAAVVVKEVNGAHDFTLTLPATHSKAYLLRNERRVQVADETFRIRRITQGREAGVPVLTCYCEAAFYDLATAGQIDAREWTQVAAGDVMQVALAGTGWTIGVANVSTLRTYSTEDTNPLALLREVQSNHGGDLIFDNNARTVSLVTSSGRDDGVAFFWGRGLTDSKRVTDTTSLITRIYARNADGLTIAGVNGGVPYIEDFSHTSELRTATYDFKSGTSPYTMLSMAQATLANRSKPDVSYEVTVEDVSALTNEDLDRFDAGDRVTVVDPELEIQGTQRVLKLEYDVMRPQQSKVTLSGRLRELGSSESTDAGVLETGAQQSAFDLVPYNLLLNGRFDNHLAHWAHAGVEVVDGQGTGDHAVQFAGPGQRWIEQTVHPDNRDAYALSLRLDADGPAGWVPDVLVQAEITYEDGSTETVNIDLT